MSSVGRVFGDFRLGERFGSMVAITPAHLVEGARLIGDFNPLHVDAQFAARSRYGAPILHGVITSALMAAPFGMAVSGTAIAYLEHDARFLAPVRAGDTLSIEWTVTELTPKAHHLGGIVAATCEARNQHGVLVATARGRMLVRSQPGPA